MSSIHISKRDGMPFAKALMIRLIGVLLSLVVCAVVIVALTKLNPVEVYKAIFSGAVGTSRRAWVTIRDALILLCVAIALTPAFKMRFWNIGAEGQVLMGGCVSAAIMIYGADHFGTAQLIPMMVVGSIVATEYPLQYDPNAAVGNVPYYPVMTEESGRLYQMYLEDVQKYKDLFLCGRLAEFKYYNMDICIEHALSYFEHIKTHLSEKRE